MEKRYNLYNLEPQFRNFLIAGNVSPITLKNYLSDFRHFAGWMVRVGSSDPKGENTSPLQKFINGKTISEYRSYLIKNNLPHKTINRRLSTVRKFCSFCISQGWMKENPAKKILNISSVIPTEMEGSSLKDSSTPLGMTINKASKSPPHVILSEAKNLEKRKNIVPDNKKGFGIQYYIAFLIILIFIAALGAGIYNQFFVKQEKTLAFATTPTRAGRILSFQGRLTDSLGNPITTATNVTFNLYNVSSGGVTLYTAGPCSTTPDSDGIFNTLIGGSGYSPTPPQAVCGTEVDSSIFTENADVYLGITVAADAEMTPRQQIANVGYALNAETLQGLPPGTAASNIPYINSQGNLLIATSNPGIRSQYASSTFTISSALSTVVQSAGAGEVILQATESGTLKFRTGGATDTENRLTIDNTGNTTITGDLNLTAPADLIFGTTTSLAETTAPTDSGAYLVGANDEFDNSTSTTVQGVLNDLDAAITTGGGSSIWSLTTGVVHPTTTTNDLAVGGTTLAASMFGIDESAGNFYFGYDNSANPTFNFEATDADAGEFGFNTNDAFYFSNANVGIGTTAPGQTLEVTGNIRGTRIGVGANLYLLDALGSTAGDYLARVQNTSTTGYGLYIQAGKSDGTSSPLVIVNQAGTSLMNVLGSGNVGIGTTTPDKKLSIWEGDGSIMDPTDLGTESLTNGNLTSGTSWTATTDCSLVTDAATCTFAAGTASTVQQASGTLAVAGVGSRWYKFVYTVSGLTGTPTANITTAFASSTTALTLTAGTQTTYFKSATTPTDFIITTTLTAGQAFTLDTFSLKEVQGGDLALGGILTGGGTTGLKVLANGNVGIGTTNPGSPLEIKGSGANSLTIRASGSSNVLGFFYESSANGQLYLRNSSNVNTVLLNTSGDSYLNAGNVGIGDTGPDAKLEVLSTTTPQLLLTYTDGTVDAGFSVDSGGDLTINPSGGQLLLADTDTLNIGGKTSLAYNAFADAADAPEEAAIAADNDLYIGGDLEVDGTIYGTVVGTVPWSEIDAPTANLSLAHAGYTTAFTFDSVTTADAFALSSSSLTTGTILDLSSTSTAGGASGLSKVLDITRSGTNTNASHTAYGLYSAVTNTGTTSTNVGGYFSASGATNNYGLIVGTGNVGIGTTGPTYKLDVSGTLHTSGAANLDGNVSTNATFISYASTAVFQASNLVLRNSGVSYFNGGNVGIGDTGPDAFLEVLGTTEQLRLTHTDGTVDSRFTVDASGNLTIDNTGTKTIIADDLQINGGDILDSNGNESIRFGTTASAVNEATLTNAATGGIVTLAATGGDTDVALSIDSKGADALNLNGTATGDILLGGGSGSTGCTLTNSTGEFTCTILAASSLKWNALTVPDGNLTLAMDADTTTFGWTSTGALDAWTNNFTNNASSSTTQNAMVINNAANGSASTDVATESLLLLQQLDTSTGDSKVVTDALKIDAAANSGITNGINITNSAGNITTGINIADTAGGTLTTGITISGTVTNAMDAGNFPVVNIGNSATDFDSSGGLTLAADLAVNGGNITSSGDLTLNPTGGDVNLGASDNLGITAATNLIFGGTTNLGETTLANDSGAYLVGAYDEFDNSASTTVQGVLNDLDVALATGGAGAMWTLASGVIYPTSAASDFAVGGATLAASMFGIDESAGNFYLGYDNSADPTLNFEATDADAGEFGFNTNDSFYFSNANVGVGVVSPGYKLEVQTGPDTASVVGDFELRAQNPYNRNQYAYFNFDNTNSRSRWGTWQTGVGALPTMIESSLIYFNNSTSNVFDSGNLYISGNVGAGTTAPDAKMEINHATGDNLRLTYNDSDGSATNYTDFSLDATGGLTLTGSAASVASGVSAEKTFFTLTPATITLTGTTQVTSLMDTYLFSQATIAGDTATVTVDDAATLTIAGPPAEGTNVSLTEAYGLKINTAATTATTAYGLYVDAPTGAGSNYGAIFASGNIGIGDTSPTATLTVGNGDLFQVAGASGDITTAGDIYVNGNDIKSTGALTVTPNAGSSLSVALSTTGDFIVNTDDLFVDTSAGVVGINTAVPSATYKLTVNGDMQASTYYDLDGVTYYMNPAGASNLGGNITMVGDLTMTDGSPLINSNSGTYNTITIKGSTNTTTASVCIEGTGTGANCDGKLNVGTIDPPYTINGKKYATYFSAMTGVKEETTGTIDTTEKIAGLGYRAVVNFDQLSDDSDLWLFSKTTNLRSNIDKLIVLTTPKDNTRTWYLFDKEKFQLQFFSSKPTTISYRLTAPRFDYTDWSNKRLASDPVRGFLLNDQGNLNPADNTPPPAPNYSVTNEKEVVYRGNLEEFKNDNLLYRITGDLVEEIIAVNQGVFAKIKAGFAEIENLIVNGTIVSPVVETTDLVVSEIQPQNNDLTINLEKNQAPGQLAKLIIKGFEGKTVTTIDEYGNASFSGQIIADSLAVNNDATISGKLIAGQIESGNLNELSTDVASQSSAINDIQALLADIKNQPAPDPVTQTNLSTTGTFDNLTVTNDANFYNATVSNSLIAGNVSISNDNILGLSWDLNISSLANINFFGGAVTIAKDGTLTTTGQLIAQAGIRTNEIKGLTDTDQVTINNLTVDNLTISDKYLEATASGALIAAADNFTQNGIFAPALETASTSAGIGILPENSSEIIIYNNTIKDSSLIYLTPTSSAAPISQLTVAEKSTETKPYFKVITNTPSTSPIKFNWLIIN